MNMVYVSHCLQGMGEPLLNWDLGSQLHLGVMQSHASDWIVLAQQFDTDPFAGIREWFTNLVATGQLWALMIGFVLGYLFRGFTSYG